jgi:aryl-alcohol dehydrogenase-like predicted oxidoreductase
MNIALGAMLFGSSVDEETSFAILDRFVDAGGTMIDTADNYAFWLTGTQGGESETMLGRWLASRGLRDRVMLNTKVGARPMAPGAGLENVEGLSAATIRKSLEDSLTRLGTDHVDLYWTHVEDRSVPLEETVGALAGLVGEGKVRELGTSNHALWRVERARAVAGDRPRYTHLQYRYSYLQPRFDMALEAGGHTPVTPDMLDYVRSEPDLKLWIYTPLLSGSYTRADKPLDRAYDHPGTPPRLAVLREVAAELGATPNQVVLAWAMHGDPATIPIVGVSKVEHIEEAIGAADVELDPDQRRRLDEAG